MIKIICVGKIKESFFREAIQEYQKRLSKYTKLEIIEIPNYTNGNAQKKKKKEALLIQKQIGPKDYVITLEIEGRTFSSEQIAEKIDDLFQNYSTITFVIGGSYGLDVSIKEKSDLSLSFSKMTFPHQLFRILLLEQIYRSYKIIHHESYHK